MRILYVGPENGTCLQRAEGLRSLGHRVDHVPAAEPASFWAMQVYRVSNRLGRPADVVGTNREMLGRAGAGGYDLLWVDKGRTVSPSTLAGVRASNPDLVAVSYSPDDMFNPANQSPRYLKSIPAYDLHVTTKSYNVEELRQAGARDVIFVDNAYDPDCHRPLELTEEERRLYSADVGFVGMYERDRAEQMLRLARNGIPVSIWGGGWGRFSGADPSLRITDRAIWGLEYSKAINATRINLGFLRKVNRDLQTTRSIEIPACRAFMLAERTDEHLRLFEEGREAEFFGSFDELLEKCRRYLADDVARERVAAAGYRRCIDGGYGNVDRLREVLQHLAGRRGRDQA